MRVLGAALLLLLAACEHTYSLEQFERGDNFRDRCPLVVNQARAPLDEAGFRLVMFLPFGYSKDSIDFYAPMQGDPFDRVAREFYGSGTGTGVGQVTHYLVPARVGAFMANCLSAARFHQISRDQPENGDRFPERFSALYLDSKTGRAVAIRAADEHVGLLVSTKATSASLLDTLRRRMQTSPSD